MIEVANLVKEFKRPVVKEGVFNTVKSLFHSEYTVKRAVDDISFSISPGELVGYIGPNGAGKSTSIKMLTGILHPTSGSVMVNGISPQKDRKANARQIGVVFGQKTQLWWDVPVIESLRLLKDIYKIPEKVYQDNLELFHDLLDLKEFVQSPVRQLSLGQRMRADLAAAFLHNPGIVFLDEPTIGIDIVAKEKLRSFIQNINAQKQVTVLLTTHDMGDIEKLCSRIMIIDYGKVIYDGSIENIRNQYGMERTLVLDLENTTDPLEIPHTQLSKREGFRFWYTFNRFETTPSQIIQTVGEKTNILDLSIEEPLIEDLIRNIYTRGRKGGDQ